MVYVETKPDKKSDRSLSAGPRRLQTRKDYSIKLKESKKNRCSQVPASTKPQITQSFIHKAVGYKTEGLSQLTANQTAVVEWIKDNFIVPLDFDISHEFGPLSGVSYEERLLNAYMFGKIEPREGVTYRKRCWECGEFGHFPQHCPRVFE